MAEEEEPILTHPGSHENAVHVQDYTRFIRLLKVGAAVCLVIGLVWMLIVKAYW